nr:hypothetical protein BCU58_20500 [Vibrio sp. 10N.286.48.B7]
MTELLGFPPQVTCSIGRNYKRALKRAMNAEFTVEELLAAEDLLFQGDDGVVGISSTSDSLNWS